MAYILSIRESIINTIQRYFHSDGTLEGVDIEEQSQAFSQLVWKFGGNGAHARELWATAVNRGQGSLSRRLGGSSEGRLHRPDNGRAKRTPDQDRRRGEVAQTGCASLHLQRIRSSDGGTGLSGTNDQLQNTWWRVRACVCRLTGGMGFNPAAPVQHVLRS